MERFRKVLPFVNHKNENQDSFAIVSGHVNILSGNNITSLPIYMLTSNHSYFPIQVSVHGMIVYIHRKYTFLPSRCLPEASPVHVKYN